MYPPLAVHSASCLIHSQKLPLRHSQHTDQCWLWDELIEQGVNINALIQKQGAKISFSTASMVLRRTGRPSTDAATGRCG